MSLSTSDLQKVVVELQDVLMNAVLQKIQAASDHEIILHFYRRKSSLLYINIQPGSTALFLTERRIPKLQPPPNIVLYLKKHLLNQRLEAITLSPARRIIYLRFNHHTLICELMHTQGNLLVLQNHHSIAYQWKFHTQRLGSEYNELLLPEEPKHMGIKKLVNLDAPSQQLDQQYQQELKQSLQKKAHRSQKSRLEKQQRKLIKLTDELKEAMDADRYVHYGKLIQSALYLLPKQKMFHHTLPIDSDSIREEIPLPRPMNARAAMEYYFKLHKKMLRRLQLLEQRILHEESYLAQLHEEIKNPQAELTETIVEKHTTRAMTHRKLAPGIQEHLSPDGFRLWIGKNALANDRLLKLCNSNDLWLHAHNSAGSHCVILREGKREIPQTTILWAAKIALKFSKAKGQGDVVIASRSDVRKFKNAKPGEVKVLRSELLHVKL